MLTDPEQDYAIGSVPFLGASICLDSRPLIPRSETEFWVEKAIQKITLYGSRLRSEGIEKPITVLDLFAGSGAIGVAVLKHVSQAHVTFGELIQHHLLGIEKTLAVNGIDRARAELLQTNVWSNVVGVFDFILANPPYISKPRGTAESSVVESEPNEALFAKDDGFEYPRQIVLGASRHLAPYGELWIEHEPYQSKRLAELSREQGFSIKTHLDQYGKERFSVLSPTTASAAL